MNQKYNKTKSNEKFNGVKSYKSLCNKGEDENYLDNLSLQILYTINEMKTLNFEYKKYNIKFPKDNKSILNSSFNEIKTLLWTRFCNQFRDYSDIIFVLSKNKKVKEKYKTVFEYIKTTNFISVFINGKDEYNAISLSLHNLNKYNYGKDKWNKSFEKYDLFNKAIVENSVESIKEEFETVIKKFRISEKFKIINIGLEYLEWSPLYKLMEFLSKNK